MPLEIIESMAEIASSSASEAYEQAINNESDPSQAFELAMNEASTIIIDMGVPPEMVDSMVSSIIKDYNEAIMNGASSKEAFDIALENIKDGVDFSNESSAQENEQNVTPEYDLDFAHSSNSPAIDLLDEAIAKGLSVEEAIKYVNNKMFPEEAVQQGPPTLANFRELDSNESNMANQGSEDYKETSQLNQMEADMDSEAANVSHENITEDDSKQELGSDDKFEDSTDDVS